MEATEEMMVKATPGAGTHLAAEQSGSPPADWFEKGGRVSE